MFPYFLSFAHRVGWSSYHLNYIMHHLEYFVNYFDLLTEKLLPIITSLNYPMNEHFSNCFGLLTEGNGLVIT